MRRALRVVLGLGLAALLLVGLAFVFLHTPPGRDAARALLEAWGSRASGGTLRLGHLDLALWKGEAAATAASFRLRGTTVDAQRVELAWSPKSGPRVRVVRPSVVVRDTGEPKRQTPPATGLAARPWRVGEGIGRAEVMDGRLELRDAEGAPWLVLGRVDAEVAEDGGPVVDYEIGHTAGNSWNLSGHFPGVHIRECERWQNHKCSLDRLTIKQIALGHFEIIVNMPTQNKTRWYIAIFDLCLHITAQKQACHVAPEPIT